MSEIQEPINTLQGSPYAEYITFLTNAYNFFNQKLANSEAPNVVITVQSRGRKPANGWFWEKTWTDKSGNLFAEVNICAERLDRPIEDILQTVIHELAHVLNNAKGVKDCNAAQYHNKEFKKMAESLGLTVSKMVGKGYALTALGSKAQAIVTEFLAQSMQPVMTINRISKREVGTQTKLYSIPATYETKQWFENEAAIRGVKQKELLTLLIESYDAQKTSS